VGSKIKSSLFFNERKVFQKKLQEIRTCIQSYTKKHGTDILTVLTMNENGMNVSIHPAEEEVAFFLKDGYIVCSAKTSNAGPGYHAYIIDMLETIEADCNFKWDWSNNKLGFCDETGFQKHKDFPYLQLVMKNHLFSLAKYLCSLDKEEFFQLSLPTDLLLEPRKEKTRDFAASPLGFYKRGFFAEIAAAEPSTIDAYAKTFFPWWNADLDAIFWKNAGLVLMWIEVKWQSPEEREDPVYHLLLNTLYCFDKAHHLDPTIKLPTSEIEEIKSLLQMEENYTPKPNLIGFYRYNTRKVFSKNWSIVVPGYFYESVEESDRSATTFFHSSKAIYCSSYIGPSNETPGFPDEKEKRSETFHFQEGEMQGRAFLDKESPSEEDTIILNCYVAVPGSFCNVVIAFTDLNALGWAINTFKSIKRIAE